MGGLEELSASPWSSRLTTQDSKLFEAPLQERERSQRVVLVDDDAVAGIDRPRIARSTRLRAQIPRKEVIQPHLPVRLPCYDFTPVTWPTFDSCLPTRGLAHRLQVFHASMV